MNRFARWLPWIFLCLVSAYVAVHWTGRVVPETVDPKLEGQARAQMDFDVYLTGARRIAEGRSPYVRSDIPDDLPCVGDETLEYIYTPLLALMLRPLVGMSPCAAEWIWIGLNFVLCAALVPLLMVALGLPRRPWVWGLVIGLVGAPMATAGTLSLGQVNFLVLGAMLVAMILADRKRPRAAGLVLGAAVCLKIVPVMLAAYLWRRAGWRSVAWAAGSALGLTTLSFALAPGWLVADYLAAVNERTVGGMALLNNASVVAGLTRAWQPDAGVIAGMARANMIVVIASAAAVLWPGRRSIDMSLLAGLSFGLAAAFTPVFQSHHQVLLYPSLLTLVFWIGARNRARSKVAGGIGLVVLAMLLNSRGLVRPEDAGNVAAHLLVKPAGVALWAMIVWFVLASVRKDVEGQ